MRKIIKAKPTSRAIPAMPPTIPPATLPVWVLVLLEDPEAAEVEVEDVPAAVDVASEPPAPPILLDAAEAESEEDSHVVDEESPDQEVEMDRGLEVALIVELAKVVEATDDEKEPDRNDCEGVKLAESVLETDEELLGDDVDNREVTEDDEAKEEVSDAILGVSTMYPVVC